MHLDHWQKVSESLPSVLDLRCVLSSRHMLMIWVWLASLFSPNMFSWDVTGCITNNRAEFWLLHRTLFCSVYYVFLILKTASVIHVREIICILIDMCTTAVRCIAPQQSALFSNIIKYVKSVSRFFFYLFFLKIINIKLICL